MTQTVMAENTAADNSVMSEARDPRLTVIMSPRTCDPAPVVRLREYTRSLRRSWLSRTCTKARVMRTLRERSAPGRSRVFFRFPPDARWNADLSAVEFGIGVGEYEGVVRVPRRVLQHLLVSTPPARHRQR